LIFSLTQVNALPLLVCWEWFSAFSLRSNSSSLRSSRSYCADARSEADQSTPSPAAQSVAHQPTLIFAKIDMNHLRLECRGFRDSRGLKRRHHGRSRRGCLSQSWIAYRSVILS
jgi:hypothetical protein